MKTYFLYNVLLNIALILMGIAVWAAYQSGEYAILAITVAILVILGWLKYRLLKQVRQGIREK